MDGKARALDNVFVERLWRSVKYEDIYLRSYESGADCHRVLSSYFKFYSHERPYQSLDYRTPWEVHNSHLCVNDISDSHINHKTDDRGQSDDNRNDQRYFQWYCDSGCGCNACCDQQHHKPRDQLNHCHDQRLWLLHDRGQYTVVFNNGAVGTIRASTATTLTITFTTKPTRTDVLTAIITSNLLTSGLAVQVSNVIWFL
jgi:putative transposase